MNNELIKIQTWPEVREEVRTINPLLAKYIDESELNADYDFVRITYGYGQFIIHNGELQLPISNTKFVSLNDSIIPPFIRDRLNYSYVPIGLILNKTTEVFYESPDRVMPTKICNKGDLFGLWEIFDPEPSNFTKCIWNIVAGARTLFMLPKISDQTAHAQLQRHYKIKTYQPSNLLQQYKTFTEIANVSASDSRWTTDILFFSKAWHPTESKKEMRNLHYFWLQKAWQQSLNCRNNMSFDMAWERFAYAVTQRNMKPKPIIINTIKHLLAIQQGIYPGYSPSINNDCGPVDLLKQIYIEVYKIKHYPTVMEPIQLSQVNRPTYYSLQLPSLIEYAPGSHGKNVITDLRELKLLMDMLEYPIESEKCFLFFHPDEDLSLNINSTKILPTFNKSFLPEEAAMYNLSFAYNSPFLKGCIQVSVNEDNVTTLPAEADF